MSDSTTRVCPYFIPADNDRLQVCLAAQQFVSHRYADSYCTCDEHTRCSVYVAEQRGVVDPLIEEAEEEL